MAQMFLVMVLVFVLVVAVEIGVALALLEPEQPLELRQPYRRLYVPSL
jgi:hypothetical protein